MEKPLISINQGLLTVLPHLVCYEKFERKRSFTASNCFIKLDGFIEKT